MLGVMPRRKGRRENCLASSLCKVPYHGGGLGSKGEGIVRKEETGGVGNPQGRLGKVLTALPVRMAHLEISAGAGRVLASTLGATNVLNLLSQALEGGVYLEVTITDIGIISSVIAARVMSLLLGWLGQEAEVETTAGGTRRTRGSRRSRGTLCRKEEPRLVKTLGLEHQISLRWGRGSTS